MRNINIIYSNTILGSLQVEVVGGTDGYRWVAVHDGTGGPMTQARLHGLFAGLGLGTTALGMYVGK